MGLFYHDLPTDVFPPEQRPYLERLNAELRNLFSLEAIIRETRDLPHRSDKSIIRGKEISVSGDRVGESTGTTPGPAFNDIPFITVTNTSRLSQERALAVSSPITKTDGGVNSTITIGIDTGVLNPLLSHDPLQDKDLGDQHANYVYLSPGDIVLDDNRNDILPLNGTVVAVRAKSSHFVLGGTGTPAGEVIDSLVGGSLLSDTGTNDVFIAYGGRIADPPDFNIRVNVQHDGSNQFSTTDLNRHGLLFTGQTVAAGGAGGSLAGPLFITSFYPMDVGTSGDFLTRTGFEEIDTDYLTDRRDLIRLVTNTNQSTNFGNEEGFDGRGSMVLGNTRAGQLPTTEANSPWTASNRRYKSRLMVYVEGSGIAPEMMNSDPSGGEIGPDVYNMNGIYIYKANVRIPGNDLRVKTNGAYEAEAGNWAGAYQNIAAVPLYIRSRSGVSGDGGVAGHRPGRYQIRMHVEDCDNATDDGQFVNGLSCLDIISEFTPQLGIVQPRFGIETKERIMLRPDRTKVNIGGDPTPGTGLAKFVYGAVEIDGRLRLWGKGLVYDDTPDASHSSSPLAAKGVDFAYERGDDFVYLYNPTGTTQQDDAAGEVSYWELRRFC
jgi:hypothetical protein